MNKELLTQLHSSDPKLRQQAILALGKAKDRAALPLLTEIYRGDPVPELRQLALKAGRYIQQQTMTLPVVDTNVSIQDMARATSHIARARDLALTGGKRDLVEALTELAEALIRNPNLAQDDDFLSFATKLLRCPPEDALRLLSQPDQLKAAFQGLPNPQAPKPPATIWQLIRPFVFLGSLVLLGAMIVGFVQSGLLQHYLFYFTIRDIKQHVQSLPNGQEYFLYVPDGTAPPDGWAVIVALHGYGGSGDQMLRGDLLAIAKNERAILITPTFKTYQDDPTVFINDTDQLQRNLHMILEKIAQEYPVSKKGAVVYGFSRGGLFATEYLASYSVEVHSIIAEGSPAIIIPSGGTYLRPCHFVYGENDSNQIYSVAGIQQLKSLGYPVTSDIVPGRGHEITSRGMYWVEEMVKAVHTD